MASTDDLVSAKKKLDQSLGDNFKVYLQTMRQWFTQQLTKEEFDTKCRQFLSQDSAKAHNAFLLALFNKCSHLVDFDDKSSIGLTHTIGMTPTNKTEAKFNVKTESKPKPIAKPNRKKLKLKNMDMAFDNRFTNVSANENQYLRSIKLLDDCSKLSKVSYCRRESALPDHFMSHLRVYVIGWEMGLDGVQDNAVKLCNAALRDFIKRILTEIFASRSSYRLRDNQFKYCIGGPPLNPYLKNSYPLQQMADQSSSVTNPETGESQSIRPTIDEATNAAMYRMACSGQQSSQLPDEAINLRHLTHCIKWNRNLIPSHTVRCNAYYKSVCKLAELESND